MIHSVFEHCPSYTKACLCVRRRGLPHRIFAQIRCAVRTMWQARGGGSGTRMDVARGAGALASDQRFRGLRRLEAAEMQQTNSRVCSVATLCIAHASIGFYPAVRGKSASRVTRRESRYRLCGVSRATTLSTMCPGRIFGEIDFHSQLVLLAPVVAVTLPPSEYSASSSHEPSVEL